MKSLKIFIKPLSAFATPLAGDTLFGQLCWAVRERFGVEKLSNLLEGYTTGNPFVVLSDGLPALQPTAGEWQVWIRKPAMPLAFDHNVNSSVQERRLLRHRVWMPLHEKGADFSAWLETAVEIPEKTKDQDAVVTQNSINRMTGTTGAAPFAPRQSGITVFPANAYRCLFCCLDESRLGIDELSLLLQDIGQFGFGKDATTGMGKFDVCNVVPYEENLADACVATTLAPCAPEVSLLQSEHCYYQPLTRFGRHGNRLAQQSAFKSPLMMLASGALLSFNAPLEKSWFGKGLGGVDSPISSALPETVHQGYSPVLPLSAKGLQA